MKGDGDGDEKGRVGVWDSGDRQAVSVDSTVAVSNEQQQGQEGKSDGQSDGQSDDDGATKPDQDIARHHNKVVQVRGNWVRE